MEDKKFRLWRGDHFLRKFIVILLICLILISGYPFFTGQVILSKEVFYGSDIHHNIPQSYYEASSWINEQPEDFRILPLPTQAGWEVYDWGQGERYIGVGVLDDMIQKPIEHYLTGNPVVDYVYQRFQEGSIDGVEKLLCLLNVKYILLHNDADQSIFGGENASYDRDQLISQKNIQLEKAFGALEFYKIPDASFVPHIYATNQYQLVTNAPSLYQSIYEGDIDNVSYSKPGDVAFFFTEQLNKDEITKINAVEYEQLYKPDITLQKVDPTSYIVHINASQPFFLVFSEFYDKGWVAYADGQQIPDQYHFVANGFANAWYINTTGTFTLTLEFWPQNIFYVGSAISVTTLILCALYVSKDKIKTIYQKHTKNKQLTKTN
jgi:hypothetical protein